MNENNYFFSWQDINFLKSELLLVLAWLTAFCGLLLPKKIATFFVPFVTISVFLANIGLLFFSLNQLESTTEISKTTFFWNDLFYQNSFSHSLKLLVSISGLLSVWILYSKANSDTTKNKKIVLENFLLLLAGVLSTQFLLISATVFGIYVSLEMLSICGYLLVAFHDKQLSNANESTSKKGKLIVSSFNYLVFGAVSSAFLLYGFSWWYGFSGSFSIPIIFESLSNTNLIPLDFASNQATFVVGFILIGIGFLFKLAIVPLHFWIGNVYKNTSCSTIFFLATIPKLAITGVLFFILHYSYFISTDLQNNIFSSLSILGVLSAIFGGFLAIQQTNFKRFFAYSGVAQMGFLLLLLVYNFQNPIISTKAILIFWIFYILSNAILWKFCAELESNYATNKENKNKEIDILAIQNLKNMSLFPKIILSVASLSLAGFPPLGGFLVKLIVFFVVYQNYQMQGAESPVYLFSLVGIGIATLIGFFYYLKIPYYLFLKTKTENNIIENNVISYKISSSTLFWTTLLILINVILALYAIRFL